MTLVELVLTIVIIGIAAAALFTATAAITARSSDPMLRQQSLMLAEAYLEEIGLQAFMPQSAESCTPARACFNDVRDYAGLVNLPPQDAFGNTLAALSGYRVNVDVSGPTPVFDAPTLIIAVTVTDPGGQQLTLKGYRTCYGEGGCP
jgi:MSHA pilin protein MshD